MILTLCDQCERILPADEAKAVVSKTGEVICNQCKNAKKNRDASSMNCERCKKIVTVEMLRSGEALFAPPQKKKLAEIYCGRCKTFVQRDYRSLVDLKYLVIIFAIFLGVPFSIGMFTSFQNMLKQNKPNSNSSDEKTEQILKELENLKQQIQSTKKTTNNNPANEDEVSLVEKSEAKIEKKELTDLPQSEKRIEKKTSVDLTKMLATLQQKVMSANEKRMEVGSASEKLATILQTAQLRESYNLSLITKALNDADPIVRNFAAKTLGVLGNKDSTTKLFSSVSDPNPFVRKSVVKSLRILTGERFEYYQDISEEDWEKIKKMKESKQN